LLSLAGGKGPAAQGKQPRKKGEIVRASGCKSDAREPWLRARIAGREGDDLAARRGTRGAFLTEGEGGKMVRSRGKWEGYSPGGRRAKAERDTW